MDVGSQMVQTPLAGLNCPSRRQAVLYPAGNGDPRFSHLNLISATPTLARADYAGNGGDFYCEGLYPPSIPSYCRNCFYGTQYSDMDGAAGAAALRSFPGIATGIFFPGSEIQISDIRDGASNTLLFGEKYLSPDAYDNEQSPGDSGSMYCGDNAEITRWTIPAVPPRQDRAGDFNWYCFGSAHAGGFNVVMCDGSGQSISYAIDPTVFRYLGSRDDQKPVGSNNL
jgi:prepilin-type processing-associated H-X9-DG protein